MLQLWRQLTAVEPLRLDCSVGRTDGPDIDAILRRQMRAWYLDLLDHGDERFLVPVDLAANASISTLNGVTHLTAPEDCRRILRVNFSGWASPLAPQASTPPLISSLNPFCQRPAVVSVSPREVIVYGAEGRLTSLSCAVDHGPQAYSFDDSALTLISNAYENK